MIFAAIAACALVAGCATTEAPKAVAAEPQMNKWEAFATALTAAKDSTAQVAIAVAFAADGGHAPQPIVQAAPQSLGAVVWQAALQAGDLFIRGYGIKTQRDVSIAQTMAQAQTTIAGYQAFTGIANAGFGSNATIAGLIQAPAPNITNTLSGTGVLGSGTYTGPVTRTCTSGQAGNGAGTTTGGAGGASGPASC